MSEDQIASVYQHVFTVRWVSWSSGPANTEEVVPEQLALEQLLAPVV